MSYFVKKATLVRDNVFDHVGESKLFELDPPLKYVDYRMYAEDGCEIPNCEERTLETKYVVVSAVCPPMAMPETFIFASDSEGNVRQWMELEGSLRNVYDIDLALLNAGYNLIVSHVE